MRPATRMDVGLVLAIDELAADKVLALFTRAQARDLVDVEALRRRYADTDLLALAREKDRGLDVRVLAQALRVASRRDDFQFEALGAGGAVLATLRESARSWAEQLDPQH